MTILGEIEGTRRQDCCGVALALRLRPAAQLLGSWTWYAHWGEVNGPAGSIFGGVAQGAASENEALDAEQKALQEKMSAGD